MMWCFVRDREFTTRHFVKVHPLSMSSSCRLQILNRVFLVSYRGVGVGYQAPHLRSISPNFPGGFCAFMIFYASASMGLQGGLVSWYLLSLLFLRRRYSSRKKNKLPLVQSPSERSILS